MDLVTTSVTSHPRSQPTIGETTISTQERERIKAEVRTVMRKQFSEARAVLRADLGLPKEVTEKSGEAAPAKSVIDLVLPQRNRWELQYPDPILAHPCRWPLETRPTSTIHSNHQPFATAAWKPKEPPCFFGRSTEDAHTWVSFGEELLDIYVRE